MVKMDIDTVGNGLCAVPYGVLSDKQQFLDQLMNADNLNNILSAYWPKPVYGKKKGLDKAVYLL